MRLALLAALALSAGLWGAGCTPALPAAAQPPPAECATDAECMVAPASSPCCPGCCECPRATSRRAWDAATRACAVASCAAPDCDHVRCEPCGLVTRAVCERGSCVGR